MVRRARLFGVQLAVVLDDDVTRNRLLACVDDLELRPVAPDGYLRRISGLLQPACQQIQLLSAAIKRLTDEFAIRSRIETRGSHAR